MAVQIVIGKTFYINNNTKRGSKREKFLREKMEITIIAQKNSEVK